MKIESELKFDERGIRGQVFCVVCQSCGAQGAWADTEELAIQAWNTIEG